MIIFFRLYIFFDNSAVILTLRSFVVEPNVRFSLHICSSSKECMCNRFMIDTTIFLYGKKTNNSAKILMKTNKKLMVLYSSS